MSRYQYYARLSKTLAKYNISINDHKSDVSKLFVRDVNFRDFIISTKDYDKSFMWYNKETTIKQSIEANPESSELFEKLLHNNDRLYAWVHGEDGSKN